MHFFSSKRGGTKHFKRGKDHSIFGWDVIIALYQREVGRAKQQMTRMIPRLKEVTHVVRDAWTKLNVSPAIILYLELHNDLQQEQVLGGLYWNVHQDPADADVTEETWQYLQAYHKLFEIGFLSHDKVTSIDSPILQSIEDGYKYFTSWLSTLLEEGKIRTPILMCIINLLFYRF